MSIIDVTRDAVALVQKLDNVDLLKKLLDVQREALAMLEENKTLLTRIRELEAALEDQNTIESIDDNLEADDGVYWRRQDDWLDGPYCTRCWDVTTTLVRCKKEYSHGRKGTFPFWRCPECKNTAAHKESPQPHLRIPRRGLP